MKNKSIVGENRPKKAFLRLHGFEHEKKRIAGELHDDVCSKLAIIRLKLCRNPNNLDEVIDLLDHALGTIRKISHNLFSPAIEHISFVNAIRDYIIPLHDIIKIEIRFVQDPAIILDTYTRLNLFRIFQEVINNILKHANASYVLIQLHFSKDFLTLSIRDNGIGLSNDLHFHSGIGLQNICIRAADLNAQYNFISSKDTGTTFEISVPIEN